MIKMKIMNCFVQSDRPTGIDDTDPFWPSV